MRPPASFWPFVMVTGRAWFVEHVPTVPCDRRVMVLLAAISGQEAAWKYRVQNMNGPAHGLWQCERGGGIAGVLTNMRTKAAAVIVCEAAGLRPDAHEVWAAITAVAYDHVAFSFARLLLWADFRPLPQETDPDATWAAYVRNWRPGRPRRDDWNDNLGAALMMVPHE